MHRFFGNSFAKKKSMAHGNISPVKSCEHSLAPANCIIDVTPSKRTHAYVLRDAILIVWKIESPFNNTPEGIETIYSFFPYLLCRRRGRRRMRIRWQHSMIDILRLVPIVRLVCGTNERTNDRREYPFGTHGHMNEHCV